VIHLGGKGIFIIGLLGAVCCLVSAVKAQKNLDVCRVTTDTRAQGYGTGIYEIGKFPIDNIEGTTEKSYDYETDGRTFKINVEVEYGDFSAVEKGKPTEIILSLLVGLADKNSASEDTPVQAGTTYGHKWGTLYVEKAVVFGDFAQYFQLTCSDGISKNGVKRGEPKWRKTNRP